MCFFMTGFLVVVLAFWTGAFCVYYLVENYEPNTCTVVDVDVMADVQKGLVYFSRWTVDVADGRLGYLTELVPPEHGQTLKMALRYSLDVLPLNTTFLCYVDNGNTVQRERSNRTGSIVLFTFAGICAYVWGCHECCSRKSEIVIFKRRKKRSQQSSSFAAAVAADEYPTYV
jgi:hypothetical protein